MTCTVVLLKFCVMCRPHQPVWNRQGLILFNSFDRRGLFQVAASGGEARAVTTLDPARQELFHAWPQFLTDSRHFIYLVQSALPENTGIYVGSLYSKERKRLINTSSISAYAGVASGSGYLLFMHAATLMAQRFDARKQEMQGEAFPVAEDVRLPPTPASGICSGISLGAQGARLPGAQPSDHRARLV